MGSKTSYDRDMRNGVKRVVVRLTKDEHAVVLKSRTRHKSYAPTLSALIRRGIELACKELDEKPVIG